MRERDAGMGRARDGVKAWVQGRPRASRPASRSAVAPAAPITPASRQSDSAKHAAPPSDDPPQAAGSAMFAVRRARVAALCGLLAARNRRYGEAEARFAEAIGLDSDLDLTALARFWKLPRGAQGAAVRTYERVGRVPDAAALAAWLRRTYRPQPVPMRAGRR